MNQTQENTQIIQSIVRNMNFITDKINILEQDLLNLNNSEFEVRILEVSKLLKDKEDMNTLLNNFIDKPTTKKNNLGLFPPTPYDTNMNELD